MKHATRLLLLLTALISLPAPALDLVPYQADEFARARKEGKITALQFHSSWCPICVMQERGLKTLIDEKAYDRVTVFQVDFFAEEALRKRFNVSTFATLVIFRGAKERARATGEFQSEQLRQLFAPAL